MILRRSFWLAALIAVAATTSARADAQLESDHGDAHFGRAVAAAGDVNGDGYADVIIGAPDYLVAFPHGAAFVFHGGAGGIPSGSISGAGATRSQGGAAAWPGDFGSVVAGVGDVNGDGYDDVAVGAPVYDISSGPVPDGAGAAFIFHGSASGIGTGTSATAATRLVSNQLGANFGYVAPAGDVNGDGYADVVVGAPGYDAGESNEGAAFLYLGGPGGIPHGGPDTADARIESNQADAGLGPGSTAAGDVNGDGFGDLLVVAPSYDAGETDEGVALLFLGGGAGISSGSPTSADATLRSDRRSGSMGAAAAAGDLDGDGYGDVIVGCPGCDNGESDEGEVFVWRGGATGIASGDPSTAATRLQGNASTALFGQALATADLNADGYDDLIVGAPILDLLGSALVYRGRSSGIPDGDPDDAWLRLDGTQPFTFFGAAVGAGDLNGDGAGDAIVGNPFFTNGQTSEGAVFLDLGLPPVVPALPAAAVAALGLLLAGLGLRLGRARARASRP